MACCDGEEEVDEVFATARKLIDRSERSDTDDQHQRGALELLNSYLLPAVSFKVQDAPFVEMAIEAQALATQKIDSKIMEVSVRYQEVKERLLKAVSDLAPDCADLLKPGSLSKDNLKALHDDIDRAVKIAQTNFSATADKYLEQKQSCEGSSGKKVASLREQRGLAHNHVIALVTAREHVYQTMEQYPDSPPKLLSAELPKKLQDYVNALEEKQRIYKSQEVVFQQKLMAASIRESLIETLKQLHEGQPAQGVTQDMYGRYATEVVLSSHGRKQTKWQDIKSFIAMQLESPTSRIGEAHHTFCSKMETQLSDIVSLLRQTLAPGEDYKSLTSAQTGVDISAFDDSDVQLEVYRDSIKPNAKQIVEHIEMMSELIEKELGEEHVNEVCTKRIWTAYERFCYDVLGALIEQMYQFYHYCNHAFHDKVEALSDKSPEELDLGLPQAPWLVIFNKKRIQQEGMAPDVVSSLELSQTVSRFSSLDEGQSAQHPLPYITTVPARAASDFVSLQADDWVEESGISYRVPTFRECFGDVSDHLQTLLCQSTPFSKLQCLTNALRRVTSSIAKLKSLGNEGSVADVGGDDLLPALVLVLTRLNVSLVCAIRYQTFMLEDLMPEFLTRGCHAFALAEFQIAFRVIGNLL